jgi:tetratricopeptide (TPR) repeat protein
MKQLGRCLMALLAAAALLPWGQVCAATADDVMRLQRGWEQIKYQTPAPDQEQQFDRLRGEAEHLAAVNPESAEVLVWYAIIESTYAGARGGLGALRYAKNAKKTLEQAISINPDALAGAAYTTLGSLYYQVPGFPIGFGDDRKAQEYLKKGLAADPDGIDPNFFYGDYLYRKGDYDSAERFLRKALQAPPRSGRKLADEGRRAEIEQLLAKIAAGR